MRFKQFILENAMTLQQVAEIIKKECKPFLEKKTLPIYRGVPRATISFNQHPHGRKPRDSDPTFNFMFNAAFKEAFNVNSVRTQSIFSTGNAAVTAEYGEPCFFFPVGDFKFGWSKFFIDSFENASHIDKRIAAYYIEHSNVKKNNDEYAFTSTAIVMINELFQELALIMTPQEWCNNIGDRAEDATIALGFKLNKLHAHNFFAEDKVYYTLRAALKHVFEECYSNNENLAKAAESRNEIFFYKTEGYYLVPAEIVMAQYKKEKGERPTRNDAYDYLIDLINKS